jgi:RNA polymerase sigma-70 factor (ECF subfamily)
VGNDARASHRAKIASLNGVGQLNKRSPLPSHVRMSTSTIPDAASDPDLVAAYRLGEQRAAAELVRRHAPALGRFLHASGADGSEIEDLVQEALFRAFRRIESWTGQASFRVWLLTIGGNLLRDQFRKRRGKVIPLDNREVPDRADPHDDLTASETAQRLREGIARLPRLQRQVFLLRVQEGSEYSEIATALGTTAGSARVHYHQAVKRLKELIR